MTWPAKFNLCPWRMRQGGYNDRLCRHGLCNRLASKDELTVRCHLYHHPVALFDLTLQDPHSKLVLDPTLDHTLERPCTQHGIEPFFGEAHLRLRRDL